MRPSRPVKCWIFWVPVKPTPHSSQLAADAMKKTYDFTILDKTAIAVSFMLKAESFYNET
jgi:hypothetical protein